MCLFFILSNVLLINSRKWVFLSLPWRLDDCVCDFSLYVIHVLQIFYDIYMFTGCMWLCWCDLYSCWCVDAVSAYRMFVLDQCATWSCTNHWKFVLHRVCVYVSSIFHWCDLACWKYGCVVSLYVPIFFLHGCTDHIIVLSVVPKPISWFVSGGFRLISMKFRLDM